MINNLENILAVLAKNAYVKQETVIPLSAFSTDFSSDTANPFDTVHVLKLTAGTAKEKEDGVAYAPDATAATVPIALSKRFYSATEATDISFERMSDIKRAEVFASATVKLGKAMIKHVNELVAAATNTTTFTPTFAGVAEAKAYATGVGIEGEAILCLSPAKYDKLCADVDVVHTSATAGNADVFNRGVIAQLNGLKVVRLPEAPTGTVGFLAQKSAIAVAARTTPLPDTQFGQVIADEKTGLAFSHKFIENADTASVKMVTEILFGAAIVDEDVIVKLTD